MRAGMRIDDDLHGRVVRGAMLSVCPAPGCTTLTMGGTCVAHDPPVTVVFPRGRPYRATSVDLVTVDVDSVVRTPVP